MESDEWERKVSINWENFVALLTILVQGHGDRGWGTAGGSRRRHPFGKAVR